MHAVIDQVYSPCTSPKRDQIDNSQHISSSVDSQSTILIPHFLHQITFRKMGFHPIELRIQILGLSAFGVDSKEIAAALDVPVRSVQRIIQRAKERGFDPATDPRVKMEYVEDAERSGRPKKGSKVMAAKSQAGSTSGSESVVAAGSEVGDGNRNSMPEAQAWDSKGNFPRGECFRLGWGVGRVQAVQKLLLRMLSTLTRLSGMQTRISALLVYYLCHNATTGQRPILGCWLER